MLLGGRKTFYFNEYLKAILGKDGERGDGNRTCHDHLPGIQPCYCCCCCLCLRYAGRVDAGLRMTSFLETKTAGFTLVPLV